MPTGNHFRQSTRTNMGYHGIRGREGTGSTREYCFVSHRGLDTNDLVSRRFDIAPNVSNGDASENTGERLHQQLFGIEVLTRVPFSEGGLWLCRHEEARVNGVHVMFHCATFASCVQSNT